MGPEVPLKSLIKRQDWNKILLAGLPCLSNIWSKREKSLDKWEEESIRRSKELYNMKKKSEAKAKQKRKRTLPKKKVQKDCPERRPFGADRQRREEKKKEKRGRAKNKGKGPKIARKEDIWLPLPRKV